MRFAIVGGPGVGKSTLVRQLGDLYQHGSYGEGEKGGNSIAAHGEYAGYAWCTTRQIRARAIIAWRSGGRPF